MSNKSLSDLCPKASANVSKHIQDLTENRPDAADFYNAFHGEISCYLSHRTH